MTLKNVSIAALVLLTVSSLPVVAAQKQKTATPKQNTAPPLTYKDRAYGSHKRNFTSGDGLYYPLFFAGKSPTQAEIDDYNATYPNQGTARWEHGHFTLDPAGANARVAHGVRLDVAAMTAPAKHKSHDLATFWEVTAGLTALFLLLAHSGHSADVTATAQNINPIPEAPTAALMGMGVLTLGGMLLTARRRVGF